QEHQESQNLFNGETQRRREVKSSFLFLKPKEMIFGFFSWFSVKVILDGFLGALGVLVAILDS
ncbi:MAG: hypothetical protein J7K09_08660, partial [Desulfuromusa sp.]|nr:hypothetical protein [Desulfuromusa sp.]